MANTNGTQIIDKINGRNTDKPKTLIGWVQKMRPELERALPKHISPDRILRIAITTIRTSTQLQNCEPMSFIAALMEAAQLGLEPNTPLQECFIIPRRIKGVLKAGFEIGYHGVITLAQNTGQYRSIYAHEVYANDKFEYKLGLNKDLIHIPADEGEGEPIYYYAVYHLLNGGADFVVWSKKKVEQHRDRYCPSAKFSNSAWQTDFIAMAKKTVLKALLNYAPKSIELAKMLSLDETVKGDIASDMTEVPTEDYINLNPEITIDKKTGEVNDNPVTNEEIKEMENAGKPGSSPQNAILWNKEKK